MLLTHELGLENRQRAIMDLIDHPTRLLFFTGKGGVGKTSLACATAVTLADRGRRVLLVSTDPASNLGQVFSMSIGEQEPTPIAGVPGLDALNINPETAAQAYRDRVVGPVRGILPAETLKGMEEQLSGACTTEIAAFDEFTSLLADARATARYDHVIFDTAPTGHTLRLLQLPTAWSNFLESSQSGASCLGPLSGLEKQRQQYARAVAELADGATTTVVLVARPQRAALAEAARTSRELAALGITNQRLVIGAGLDAHSRALLEEDLRSPCTEEIAVFQALSRVMQESRRKFVVVDTAPTGHTLLLIDATGAYHRDVVRHASPDVRIVTPMMRLQDPAQTKMVIVTLPETTPVLEAEALESDLRRAGIEAWAWVVNSSLAAASPHDPLLVARARQELPHIDRVVRRVVRAAIIPWMSREPVGSARLAALVRGGGTEAASTAGR